MKETLEDVVRRLLPFMESEARHGPFPNDAGMYARELSAALPERSPCLRILMDPMPGTAAHVNGIYFVGWDA